MEKIDKLAIASIVLLFGLFAIMSKLDHDDQLAAEEHAKHVKQLAQQEEAQRKAEWNSLAKRGEYYSGIGSKQQ